MLYMVGKIFLSRVCFIIVYNESGHENMNKMFNKYLFLQNTETNISNVLKWGWRCMKQHSVIIHTYIYQVGPFKFRLLVKILYNLLFIFDVGVKMQVLPSGSYLYFLLTNINGKSCKILTNNLNL